MKIGIVGCTGRMGKALIEEVQINNDCQLAGGAVRHESEFVGMDVGVLAGIDPVNVNAVGNLESLFEHSDAVIDFSNPITSIQCAEIAASKGKIHAIGTTGFTEDELLKIKSCGEKAPILWASNMSIGINLLSSLVKQVASILDDTYDIEIVEMHHCHKKDAPSGTALTLGESAALGRQVKLNDVANKSRDGIIGARERGEIGFSTIRGGDVIGDHTVIFAGDGERIELSHKASNRRIYAKGAVRACLWLKDKKPGFYNMEDVLEIF